MFRYLLVIDLIYLHNSHIADDVVDANPDRFETTGDELIAERKRCVAGLFYTTIERFIQEKCEGQYNLFKFQMR